MASGRKASLTSKETRVFWSTATSGRSSRLVNMLMASSCGGARNTTTSFSATKLATCRERVVTRIEPFVVLGKEPTSDGPCELGCDRLPHNISLSALSRINNHLFSESLSRCWTRALTSALSAPTPGIPSFFPMLSTSFSKVNTSEACIQKIECCGCLDFTWQASSNASRLLPTPPNPRMDIVRQPSGSSNFCSSFASSSKRPTKLAVRTKGTYHIGSEDTSKKHKLLFPWIYVDFKEAHHRL